MGLDRRGFIKFIAGGAMGTLLTPVPYKVLMDDVSIWTQNWSWIPRNISGVDNYTHTTSKLCPSGCGLVIRTVGGQPVRALGDPEHPLSEGRITSLAAAEVQLLYSPARVKRPLRRTPDGAYVATGWDEAAAILQEKLGGLAGSKDKIACVSGDENGTINEVLSGFTAKAGSNDFFIMPCDAQAASLAFEGLMGGAGQLGFDLENSTYVLALGADILESWGTVVRNRRAYAAAHPVGKEAKARYVYAGPVMNNTAAGADEWIPIKPGTEAVLALGLANLLIQAGASIEGEAVPADYADFKALVAGYTPDKVAAATGISVDQLKKLAKELKAASSPLVIPGSAFGQGSGVAPILAGIALNMLLGNLNKKGGMVGLPDIPKVVEASLDRKAMFANDLVAFLAAVEKGQKKPEAIIFYEANPVYGLPKAEAIPEVLQKIPFKVAFTSFLDETALCCDLILPVPMGLERVDDVVTPYGSGTALYSPVFPVISPLVDAKPAGDVILALAKKLNLDLGFASFKNVLDAKAGKVGAKFDSLKGKYVQATTLAPQQGISLKPALLAEALKAPGADGKYPLALAPMDKLNVGTASVATPPFNLKTIRDTELKGMDVFVHLNKATASRLGLKQNDLVKVGSKAGECRARVNIYEGVMNDVVAAPLGFGHTAFDEFTRGKGDNIAKLFVAVPEPGVGLTAWAGTTVNIAKI